MGNSQNTYNHDNEQKVSTNESLITKNTQFTAAQTNLEVLPALIGKCYVIHGGIISINNTTDVDVKSGLQQIFYLNAPSSANANSVGSGGMHLMTPENTNIVLNCGAGTFLSVTYHIEDC